MSSLGAAISRDTLKLIGAALAGCVLASALAHVVPCPFPLKSRSKGVFVLAVTLKIKPGSLALFKEKWAAVAKHARSSAEPGCLSYELAVSTESDEDLIIYERYVTVRDQKAWALFLATTRRGACRQLCRQNVAAAAREAIVSYPSLRGGAKNASATQRLFLTSPLALQRADLEGPHNAGAAFKAFGKWLNEESGILVSKR